MYSAVVQMNSGNDWQKNFQGALSLCQQAAEAGAELIVLPENFLAWGKQSLKLFSDPNNEELEQAVSSLVQFTKDHAVAIVAGTIPFARDGKPPYTRQLLIDQGVVLAQYDKIHLFDVEVNDKQGSYRESDSFSPGSEAVCID